jgi:LEA14-like dessication related protein
MIRVSILCYAAALLLLASLSSCALLYRDLQEPAVQLISVAPQQISFSGVKLLCRLRVDNPNDVSLPIKAGQFDLEIEGTQIAHGTLVDGFTVPALGSEFVDVIVDVDAGRSLALAIQLLSAGEQEFDYALTGHIDVAISILGRVHINETGRVPLTSEPALGGGGTSTI